MKKKSFWLGIRVMVLVSGMVIAGCANSVGPGTDNNDNDDNNDDVDRSHGIVIADWPVDEKDQFYFKRSEDGLAIALNPFGRGGAPGIPVSPSIFEVQEEGRGVFPIGKWISIDDSKEYLVFTSNKLTRYWSPGAFDPLTYSVAGDYFLFTGEQISNDIDEDLIGTWNEKDSGSTLFTITVSSTDGITWGGSSGKPIQDAADALINQGYDVAWIAKDGKISYVYLVPGQGKQTMDVYDYEINNNGELELKVKGAIFMTLAKDDG